MMNLIKDIDPGNEKELNVVIEISKGSKNKVEYNPKSNSFKLERTINKSLVFPGNYGFVPGTLSGDGDPLDAYVLTAKKIKTKTKIKVRPIAVLKMIDGKERDYKLICVPMKSELRALKDLPKPILKELKHFSLHYKDSKRKKVRVLGFGSVLEARNEFKKVREWYKKKQKK